jgi:hypothetical protein
MPNARPAAYSRAIANGLAGIGIVLAIVILIPFSPSFPRSGLDPSWQFAMNMATAHQLRFGKDVILTFGPLASVYTHLYSPETDALMMAASFAVTLALAAGLVLISRSATRPWLVLLPLIVSQRLLDPILIVLPFLLLCACENSPKHSRFGLVSIILLAIASGLLPLIKGSATLSVAVCVLFSGIALWQHSRGTAIGVLAVTVSALIIAWICSGQNLTDLPSFFFNQGQIIAGYTDAMSSPGTATNGNLIQLVVYLALAFLLIWFTWRWTNAWRLTAGLALTLFMCWKAGFVRHDGHAPIAAGGLFLCGYMIFLRTAHVRGIAVLALGFGGWLVIAWSYVGFSPAEVFGRTANALSKSSIGAMQRLNDPQHLKRQYSEAVARIAQEHPLPEYSGTVDLYTANLGALLANGARWAPRPIIQSYAAYTPDLLDLNKRHLLTAAPSRIYFNIEAIDNRYPSLEDGASWPTLLSNYAVTGFAGDYTILQRRDSPNSLKIGEPILARRQMMGANIAIPVLDQPVWAEIDIRPTLLGRLISALYKAPELFISVKYPGGTSRAFRFVSGLGKTGFLLSPTIGSARDFAALQSTAPHGILGAKYLTEFAITGTSGTWLLWEKSFDVTLSPLKLVPDRQVDDLLLNRSVSVVDPMVISAGGDCSIDSVGGGPMGVKPLRVDSFLDIQGWALVSARNGEKNRELLLAVSDSNGIRQWWTTTKMERPDVGNHFHHPEILDAGFGSLIDLQALSPGSYDVKLVQRTRGGDMISCPTVVHVTR